MSHGVVKSSKKENGAPSREASREGSESLAPPPDGGWGWAVVFASFMVHVLTDGLTYSFGVFYNEFLTYFEEGEAKTAWIVSILVGVTLSAGPLAGSFVNRWGCQAVTVAGALLASACVAVSAFANNVLTLIFTIGIGAGFGLGLIYLPAIVSVTAWFERYRSLATGIAVCGSGLGTFLFAPIIEALISNYGWRGAMAIIGALMLNCVPLGLMFKPVPEVSRTPANEPMLPAGMNTPLKRSQSTDHMIRANGKTDENDIARLTLSQPALNKNADSRIHKHSRSRHGGSGIMERPDVLYLGSVVSLQRSRAPSHERTLSISTKAEHKQKCGWLPCSSEFKAALSEMLDLTLLVDPVFILFCISNFLTSIGFYVPYVYIKPMGEKLALNNPALLLSVIGASNVIGRIILGIISDKPWANRLVAYNVCLIIAGISTALFVTSAEFWVLSMYAAVFGFTVGAYVGLTSVVLVDLVGLEKLTNAFGLLLLFQGIASLIGSPIAGFLYDTFTSYVPAFCGAGVAISLSGLILFLIPLLQRRNEKNRWNQETVLEQI